MTARSLSEIFGNMAPAKLSRAVVGGERVKVRRHSYYPDDRRATAMWKPIERNPNRPDGMTIGHRIRAAEEYNRHGRERGQRMGPLGEIGLEVLRALYLIVDYKTGRLDPAIDTICEKVKRSRRAVVQALDRLRQHGFLDWVRRAEPIPDAEGCKGPQVKQISNAYQLLVPEKARQLLSGIRARLTPVCEDERRKAAKTEARAMLDGLDLDELAEATIEAGPLRTVLARVGALVDARNANIQRRQNPDTQR